jgi:hypothetical protein
MLVREVIRRKLEKRVDIGKSKFKQGSVDYKAIQLERQDIKMPYRDDRLELKERP